MTSGSTPSMHPRRIAVIGGGITGLAAAHRLLELDPSLEVTLLEGSGRVGGVLETERRDGYLIERSADMFTTREPWALDLCRRIGIESELIQTNSRYRRAFVVRCGKLVPVPAGFTLMSPAKVWPVVKTPLLSPLGKLRLAWEYFVPAKRDGVDESLESFVVRRFGREAFDRLIQPLIGGIYTADPAKLSMQATMPQFVEMERETGSLIRGMRKSRGKPEAGDSANGERGAGARYGMFLAPRDGMERLVQAVAAKLPQRAIRVNAPVEWLERKQGECSGWHVQVAGESAAQEFDAILLAAPAKISGKLLNAVHPQLASLVTSIPAAGCCVALLAYRRDQIAHSLDGFGFVVPARENRQIIAGSFTSIKFAGRAPDGKVLMRVFVGGALQPELLDLSDDNISRIVTKELAELLGTQGQPEFCNIAHWQGMMPQYHIGHLELVRRIEEQAAKLSHFALAGNSFHGVGVPFCIHDGEQAAEHLLAQLGKPA